jgi:hypothetical protein
METSNLALTRNDRPLGRDPECEASDEARWRDLVAQISVEIAGPLTAALERIHALTSTGRIDRHSLRALREEVERAREAGIVGQQLARFASRRLRQSHERLPLTQILKSIVAHRSRAAQSRGIRLRHVLKSAEVIVDASLLSSLLNTLLDWTLANAQSDIELRVELEPCSAHARLTARFAHRPLERLDDGPRPGAVVPGLDSLGWRLLQQTAWTMGLPIERRDHETETQLSIEFPRTVNDALEGASSFEIDQGFAPSSNSKPLAGNHVLVVTPRRELRTHVSEAVRTMGLIIDFVASIEEAREFCREGLPHAIVVETALCGESFERLREEILADAPDFVFIEVIEGGDVFEISSFSGSGLARISRDAIAASLPSSLMFELSKGL